MKKERDVFDLIKEAQEELNNPPRMNGQPAHHHNCNHCGHLFSDSELFEYPDIGLLCEDCKDGMEDLDREQEDAEELATLIREEKRSKCLP